uniref:PRA1 family protein n=1 Tax=Phallusia mammillata TaxID=59560 RepID=A0A6F9DQ63_9ASCI|nr:PRA1 family protein 2-like [Phallusia mammillata]
MTSNELQLAPFRNIDDFLFASARFAPPNYQDKERMNNRILQNLLYYQTNYLCVAFAAFCCVLYFQPLETLIGAVLVLGSSLVFIYVSENRHNVGVFKRDHPNLVVFGVILSCSLVMYTLGSIMVFLLSIALPVLLVLLHATFRMRNFRNKVQNKAEAIGLKTTPMGVILKALGQETLSF